MPTIISRFFLLSFIAQFTFSLVFCLLIPTIPIYLSRWGAKEGEIGFLIGVFSVSSLILRPFVGKALLTTSERDFMVAGTLLYVVSCLAYLIAPPFWPLFIVRIVHGIGMAFFATASFTLLAGMLPEANRGRLISYYYLSFNLSFALGPYLGMILINNFNFYSLFLVCTGLSLCSFYLTLKFEKRDPIPFDRKTGSRQPLLSRGALPPATIAFMLNFIWGSIAAFLPLYALHHGVSNPGIFFIFLALTLMLGRVFGGRILDVYNRRKVITLCLFIIIIGLTILPFANSLALLIPVAVILGTGWAFLYPFLTIHVIENAGLERGPAMGTFTALGDLGAGLGPMLMGIVLEIFNYQVMFASLVLAGVLNYFYFHRTLAKKA